MHAGSTDRTPSAFRTRDSRLPAKPLPRMVDGEMALGHSEAKAMGKLKIQYVQRLRRCAEDLPPDVVELWIGVSGRKVDVNIVRRGFILAAPVMRLIRERIKRLALATSAINKPLPERIGFSPDLSPDWRQFLDELLQKDDSWSFLVNSAGSERPS